MSKNKQNQKLHQAGLPKGRIESIVSKPEVQTHKLLPSEKVMPDDYPMYGMYVYIIDNVATRCMDASPNLTVAEYKRKYGAKEIRKLSFDHEGARLGDRFE